MKHSHFREIQMMMKINPKSEYLNPKQYQNSNIQMAQTLTKTRGLAGQANTVYYGSCFEHLFLGNLNLFRIVLPLVELNLADLGFSVCLVLRA